MRTLTYLLQNLYNSKWPIDFNGSAFVQGEDLIPVEPKDIALMSDEDQQGMALALIKENDQLRKMHPAWYDTWVTPLCNYLAEHHIT